MTDRMVLQTQQWLNKTYGSDSRFKKVAEDGLTGWATIYALTRALQIELGIQSTADNFGPSSRRLFSQRYPKGVQQQADNATATSNVYAIIQGALWCKGYSTGAGSITQHFYSGTGNAIEELKSDMGIDGDSSVDVDIMGALLSMKQFVLLSNYGGTASIRMAQQSINRKYRSYTGIIPTDGLYGREMNTALIQVLQALEGFSPSEATGNFGTGTRGRLKTITKANAANFPNWVWLASVALACNGAENNPDTVWNDQFAAMVKAFQQRYALIVTGEVDSTTWMSLLTSKGDPDRYCVACDTRFEITSDRLATLKANGYEIVGRYLTEPKQETLTPDQYFKAIRPGELERITKGGMKFFPIYQEYSNKLEYFTAATGAQHAKKAREAAQRLGIPPTHIYFAVDFDATDNQVTSNILPYFRAVHSSLNGGYGIGIYASCNICTRIIKAGYASSAFVSDMSTGFSGNLGFPIPDAWAYDQFTEITNYQNRGWDLDRVAYSGQVAACNSLIPSPAEPSPDPDPETPKDDPLLKWTIDTEEKCKTMLQQSSVSSYTGFIGEFILEWLRKPEYWGNGYAGLWTLYTPEASSPSDLETARQYCAITCGKQPSIKGTLPRRDIAHMAATALGYLSWGVEDDIKKYGLGDLGGWPLDLLQIWGSYVRENPGNLSTWLNSHLGSLQNGKGFGYADILADADAWLIARYMSLHPGSESLSNAMNDVFKQSETHRIIRFYDERFGSSADNVVTIFKTVANGIDAWGIENVPFSEKMLKAAANGSARFLAHFGSRPSL
ncbi:glycoside hydrolase domain-containing protein [Bifidobacterium leontopitheci]|uniref:Putative peptidoglycan binding domain-containing protein n=1 Tax=Bifidobacterium leontopitheci TaxID=2650774 RepID=A0A6I1GP82_9BIFI|nr:glycoside hydrolase domain-containing protein [Bifidobacterium leontopitheci]KAB7789868.1 putative peptidoglycan binding domain-containing protein [Bifidobacterium leontopitheci]